VGEFPVDAKVDGRILRETRNVFAARLIITQPKWNSFLGHYTWRRFAASTWPAILSYKKWPYGKRRRPRSPTLERSTLIEIPWPIQKRWLPPAASLTLDTPIGVVQQVSWMPTAQWMEDIAPLQTVAFPPQSHYIEDNYLRASFEPTLWAKLHAGLPMEVFITRELANPNSRSKRQARWQARRAAGGGPHKWGAGGSMVYAGRSGLLRQGERAQMEGGSRITDMVRKQYLDKAQCHRTLEPARGGDGLGMEGQNQFRSLAL